MSDKHLFRKKKNDAVEPETMAPDMETQDTQDSQEFVYGMDAQENDSSDKLDDTETAAETGTDEEEGVERLGSEENIIECDSLVKIYKTDDVEVMALQGLELNIKYGELMAVIGKSGSGKSTLLNMIGGLERPTAGKLYVDGKDLFAMTDKELVEYRMHTVGFVWQKNSRNLLPYMTAIENVQVPMYFDKSNKEDKYARAHDLLCKVGLEDKINSYPSQM